ncbi:leucine-rich repeat-containing protein 43-like [Cheilinus undulatus]|uniref:leucine-rich repeat-containing protein 43-like n=1 Tax=Cheilinus undulatus TaxID=241271 RepID=UPI001BD201DD|nr:leucine-rich repeat-containing protein 43-like [Cheilinus undulatus]
MSPNMLSAVIQKLIRRLCLDDFPCGHGSWRNTNGAEREETDALLDLLSCPHSPWWLDTSWSPQAPALRQLAVLTPHRLHGKFIYGYFTTLRIVDKDVSVIDDGLLKFTNLGELVLGVNNISKIPAENLPSTLKILELCANQVSSLNSLTSRPPPRLQHLGLSSNGLGSNEDVSHLTGRHWPQLVCLDLSDCEFQDQRTLLNALSTLPCLRTLMLEGNPFTLASCYPGFTVDSLPQLFCLDTLWISSEERHRFRGLADIRDLMIEQASVTVSIGRMRGIPDPLKGVDEIAPEFPVVSYSYYISYNFFSNQTDANQTLDSESKNNPEAAANETESSFSDVSNKSSDKENETLRDEDIQHSTVHTEKTCCDAVSMCSTLKLAWSECLDFSDTRTFPVSDLKKFKRFLKQGLPLRIEEEKILSWPAVSEDVPAAKLNLALKEKKGGKGKEIPNKSGSIKDKPKDKKKKSAQELVHDAPITRVLASVHVPLENLLNTGQKIDVLCEFGELLTESEDAGRKTKEDGKTDEKDSKGRGGSGTRQKNSAASKGKGKGRKESDTDDNTDNSVNQPTSSEENFTASGLRGEPQRLPLGSDPDRHSPAHEQAAQRPRGTSTVGADQR